MALEYLPMPWRNPDAVVLFSVALLLCSCGEGSPGFGWGNACEDGSGAGGSGVDGNQPPGAPVTRLSPTIVSPLEPIRCVVDEWSIDPDGDTVSYRFSWLKDDRATDHTEMIIHGTDTEDGEVWTCVVTPFDGQVEGPAGVAAVSIGLDHPLPTAPVIRILPDLPVSDDDLRCVIEEPSVDLHSGEPVTYLFEWLKDDELYISDLSEINAELTSTGEEWTCVVIPRGLSEDGPRITDSVVIGAGTSP